MLSFCLGLMARTTAADHTRKVSDPGNRASALGMPAAGLPDGQHQGIGRVTNTSVLGVSQTGARVREILDSQAPVQVEYAARPEQELIDETLRCMATGALEARVSCRRDLKNSGMKVYNQRVQASGRVDEFWKPGGPVHYLREGQLWNGTLGAWQDSDGEILEDVTNHQLFSGMERTRTRVSKRVKDQGQKGLCSAYSVTDLVARRLAEAWQLDDEASIGMRDLFPIFWQSQVASFSQQHHSDQVAADVKKQFVRKFSTELSHFVVDILSKGAYTSEEGSGLFVVERLAIIGDLFGTLLAVNARTVRQLKVAGLLLHGGLYTMVRSSKVGNGMPDDLRPFVKKIRQETGVATIDESEEPDDREPRFTLYEAYNSGSAHAMFVDGVAPDSELDKDGLPLLWVVKNSWGEQGHQLSVIHHSEIDNARFALNLAHRSSSTDFMGGVSSRYLVWLAPFSSTPVVNRHDFANVLSTIARSSARNKVNKVEPDFVQLWIAQRIIWQALEARDMRTLESFLTPENIQEPFEDDWAERGFQGTPFQGTPFQYAAKVFQNFGAMDVIENKLKEFGLEPTDPERADGALIREPVRRAQEAADIVRNWRSGHLTSDDCKSMLTREYMIILDIQEDENMSLASRSFLLSMVDEAIKTMTIAKQLTTRDKTSSECTQELQAIREAVAGHKKRIGMANWIVTYRQLESELESQIDKVMLQCVDEPA